jgi:hypothetical protein
MMSAAHHLPLQRATSPPPRAEIVARAGVVSWLRAANPAFPVPSGTSGRSRTRVSPDTVAGPRRHSTGFRIPCPRTSIVNRNVRRQFPTSNPRRSSYPLRANGRSRCCCAPLSTFHFPFWWLLPATRYPPEAALAVPHFPLSVLVVTTRDSLLARSPSTGAERTRVPSIPT